MPVCPQCSLKLGLVSRHSCHIWVLGVSWWVGFRGEGSNQEEYVCSQSPVYEGEKKVSTVFGERKQTHMKGGSLPCCSVHNVVQSKGVSVLGCSKILFLNRYHLPFFLSDLTSFQPVLSMSKAFYYERNPSFFCFFPVIFGCLSCPMSLCDAKLSSVQPFKLFKPGRTEKYCHANRSSWLTQICKSPWVSLSEVPYHLLGFLK